jgi:hypothetical protein
MEAQRRSPGEPAGALRGGEQPAVGEALRSARGMLSRRATRDGAIEGTSPGGTNGDGRSRPPVLT